VPLGSVNSATTRFWVLRSERGCSGIVYPKEREAIAVDVSRTVEIFTVLESAWECLKTTMGSGMEVGTRVRWLLANRQR
jgi:hypothetical protein